MLAFDAFLDANKGHWLAREILHYWKRVLKRVDVTSRSLVALIEPGSCFAGTLAEIVFACDRSFMLIGACQGDNRPPATLALSALNFGAYPMSNDLTRLATRFLGEPAERRDGQGRDGQAAGGRGLREPRPRHRRRSTTSTGTTRCASSWRSAPPSRADGLTGMEANLRFAGPETMETKIFGRLTAWQNWIFQRPNAAGAEGALKRYGSGVKANFNPERV